MSCTEPTVSNEQDCELNLTHPEPDTNDTDLNTSDTLEQSPESCQISTSEGIQMRLGRVSRKPKYWEDYVVGKI